MGDDFDDVEDMLEAPFRKDAEVSRNICIQLQAICWYRSCVIWYLAS